MAFWSRNHITTDILYQKQSQLWGADGAIGELDDMLSMRRKDPRIVQLMDDLINLEEDLNTANPAELSGRMSAYFKVECLERIDSVRRQMKEQKKNEKRNCGNHKAYEKPLKKLKSLRRSLVNCKCVEGASWPLVQEIPPGGRNAEDRGEGDWWKDDEVRWPPPPTAEEIHDLEEELARVQHMLNRPLNGDEKFDSLVYKRARKRLKMMRAALAAAGISAAIVGLTLTIGGAVAVSFSYGTLVPVMGIGATIVVISAGEVFLAMGPTLAFFGTSGAIYKRFRLDPATKKFIRKHYPEQMVFDDYVLNGRTRHLDFSTRMNMIEAWAEDFNIKIGHEEVIWYSCKDNFQRFLKFRHLIGTKLTRQELTKMMKLERRNLLWASTIEAFSKAEAIEINEGDDDTMDSEDTSLHEIPCHI